jgi:two-component system, response regulator YesN
LFLNRFYILNYKTQVISSDVTDKDIYRLKQYNLDTRDANHYGCLVEIEDNHGEIELINLEKILVLINELTKSLNPSLTIFHSLIIQDGVFFVAKGFDKSTLNILDMFLYEILQNAEQFLNLRIHIGISEKFRNIKDFPTLYQEAKKAISYSFMLNTGRIVYIKEVEKRKETKVVLSNDDVKKIENAIKFGSTDEVKNILNKYKNEMQCGNNSIFNHKNYIISLSNLILTFSECINDEVSDIVGPNFLDKMLSFSSIDELFSWTEIVLLELKDRNVQSNISKTEKIIKDCLEYVDQNFANPNLSLNLVCEVLDVSISYLSMLLKKNKNITFNKYVVEVRMKEAIRLLKTTNEKIINIATQCGYHEVYYFSHRFKKYTGYSPKKYRELNHV